MNMQEINARVLSNGMTRLDWWTKLNIGQDPVPCQVNARKILDVPFGTDSDRQKYDVYMPNERCVPHHFPCPRWRLVHRSPQ